MTQAEHTDKESKKENQAEKKPATEKTEKAEAEKVEEKSEKVAEQAPEEKAQEKPEKEEKPEAVAQNLYNLLRSGQTVRLHMKVAEEGKKVRTQIFEGIILGIQGNSAATRTITVRKQSKGYGVERIVPLASPVLAKIEVVRQAKVRRSKLYYLRNYKKRLRETMVVEK